MKNIADLFRESIKQYTSIIVDAAELNKVMKNLAPREILRRCKILQQRQEKQKKIDIFIIEILADADPRILNTPVIGEYQRILDLAMQAYDKIAINAKAARDFLKTEMVG